MAPTSIYRRPTAQRIGARPRSANRYPARICYGNTPSLLVEPDVTKLSWLFEVVFDYGEGYLQLEPPDSKAVSLPPPRLRPPERGQSGRIPFRNIAPVSRFAPTASASGS